MKDKPLHLLVIAGNPDDVQLLEEAFLELDEVRFTRDWLRPVDRVYAIAANEALALASHQAFDAVMLDLNLGDNGAEAVTVFHGLQQACATLPILLLANPNEEPAALNLVRQGAHDYILKTEVDCIPLARTLTCAVARARFNDSRHAQSLVDELTGLWNQRGFSVMSQTQLSLAGRCGLPVLVAAADVPEAERGNQLRLLEAADAFRAALPPDAIAARLEGCRFAAVLVPGSASTATNVEGQLNGWMKIHWTMMHPKPGCEAAVQGALQSLCENVGVAARAGRHL
jgi:PleD family two-component response regulator